MKYPVHLLLLLTILILAACSESPTPAASTHDPSRTPVRTAPVEQVSTTPAIQVTGLIASSNEARPSFKTGGVIRRLLVDEGDRVQQGQLLATLDLTEIGAQVGQAREGLNKAERDLQRAQRLLQDSVAKLEEKIKEERKNNTFSMSKSGDRLMSVVRSVQELANELESTSKTVTGGEYSVFSELRDNRKQEKILSLGENEEARATEESDSFEDQPEKEEVEGQDSDKD